MIKPVMAGDEQLLKKAGLLEMVKKHEKGPLNHAYISSRGGQITSLMCITKKKPFIEITFFMGDIKDITAYLTDKFLYDNRFRYITVDVMKGENYSRSEFLSSGFMAAAWDGSNEAACRRLYKPREKALPSKD